MKEEYVKLKNLLSNKLKKFVGKKNNKKNREAAIDEALEALLESEIDFSGREVDITPINQIQYYIGEKEKIDLDVIIKKKE